MIWFSMMQKVILGDFLDPNNPIILLLCLFAFLSKYNLDTLELRRNLNTRPNPVSCMLIVTVELGTLV